MTVINIGLTQRVIEHTAYPERRDALDQAWARFLEPLGIRPLPIPNQISNAKAFVKDLALQGLIFTGGNDLGEATERDQLEHELIELATHMHLPILGVCRGLQILAAHYGTELTEVQGHVAQPHELNTTHELLQPHYGTKTTVNSFHNFALMPKAIKPELIPIAQAKDESIEAVKHAKLPFWGIMWHPERTPKNPGDLKLIQTIFKMED